MTLAPQSSRRMAIPRRQEGFTLVLVLGVLLITSLLLVAAFTAANGEVHLTNTDRAQKKAYYAAEAGIEDYEYHLTQDGNYLTYCTSPPSENKALNQEGAYPLHRVEVPPGTKGGPPTNEEYAIQLLPAESDPFPKDHQCDPLHLVETMVEEQGSATGTFRIESTGYSGGAERTLVATFRNANFVSYVWYTKYETGDPVIYGEPPAHPPYPTALPNYFAECANFYGLRPAQGQLEIAGVKYPLRCLNNFFISSESVNGPMHTADHGGVCGSPTFGRNEHDRIEFGNGGNFSTEGYSNEGCGTAATPTFKGTYVPPEKVLSIEPPPGDEELKHLVEPAYLYTGKTEFVLEGSTMTVNKYTLNSKGEIEITTTKGVEYPPNGIIYVTGGCTEAYTPYGPKPRYYGNEAGAASDTTCGNVYVHGEYTKSLTIAAENDIVINGNLTTPVNGEGTPTTNALLGLIANNFVRIYHPVVETYEGTGPELETTGVQLESAAGHKETIRAEPLESGLKMEVKPSGSEYEIVVTNSKYEVLEKIGPFIEASQLLGLTTKYVKYTEGTKYAEGKAEALKSFAARSFGVVKISPEKPNLGKELQVEVEEAGSKSKVKIKNTKGEVLETKEVEKASQLTGSTSNAKYEQNGASHAQGEKEKLKTSAGKWLDEKCKENGQKKIESFDSTVRLCEYTDEAAECDAPNNEVKDLKEPTIYAAMLAVKHAVIVDNFICGSANLKNLNVYGAVAGLYTDGFTGEFSGSTIIHGYPYDANYDNRLQIEEPPHFLNPVQAAWYVQRQTIAPNP
jgi:Tfp pilus assembly protein PilE